jgi:hypothetical protein
MNPQFDLVTSLLNVPKYAPYAWPHLTQRSRAATGYFMNFGRWNFNCAFYYYYKIRETIYKINKSNILHL